MLPAIVSSSAFTSLPTADHDPKPATLPKGAPAAWVNAVDINQQSNSSTDVVWKDGSYSLGGVVLDVNLICKQLRPGKRPPSFLIDSKVFQGKECLYWD